MAFNPLQQKMADAGQTAVSRGVTAQEATSQIAALLDDEGRSPGHVDRVEGDESNRENEQDSQNLDENQDFENPDLQEDANDIGDTGNDDTEGDIEGDATDDTGDDESADTDEQDSGAIENLADLAEALEMAPDDLMAHLKHTVKAAGEDRTVTLADLVEGYQLKADYDRDKTALAETQRRFQAEQQQRVDDYQQHAQILSQQFNLVEAQLAAKLQDPRFAQLREDDPAEWNAQVLEVQQQVAQLREARQQAAQQYETFLANERQAFMQAEGEKLRTTIPEWGDDKLRSAVDTIKSLGYDDSEVVNVVDSRLIQGALELASLRAENSALKARIDKGEKAAAKIKKTIPKGIKPGPSMKRKGPGVDRSKVSKLKHQLSKSNSVDDAAKVIESLMN